KLISMEAKKLGLGVTEEEIQKEIATAFKDENGLFDERRYNSYLSYINSKPEDFEESLALDILQQKVVRFLSTFSIVSDQDVLDYYRHSNEKVRLSFVQFLPEDFKDSVEVDQDLMKKYLEDNKEDYRIPEKIQL